MTDEDAVPARGGATFVRQVQERGVRSITLAIRDGDGVGLWVGGLPGEGPRVDFHNFFNVDRSDMGYLVDPREVLSGFHRARFEDVGAGWALPFVVKLVRGGDFGWDDLAGAHREAMGFEIRHDWLHG